MSREIRPYEDSDFDAVVRQWREIGWINDSDRHKESLGVMLSAGSAEVGLVDGEAEAMAHRTPGSIRYRDVDLVMLAITAVTTSRVSRRLGFASELTARALAHGAEAGAAVATLGIFDQGFYDRFGFGTGSYIHTVTFDPAMLTVQTPNAIPVRLSADDYAEIHSLMMRRERGHGSCVLDPPEMIWHELMSFEKGFGLGFRTDGRLTHFFYAEMEHARGPCKVRLLGYESGEQLLELLGLLKSMADQLLSVSLIEPQEVQLQDLLRRPFRERTRTKTSEHAVSNEALAWWQARILDVDACLGQLRWPGEPFTFNLSVTDPLADLADDGWRGIGGEYVVGVGEQTSVEVGHAADGDTLTCSVNALTRLWLGVASTTNLALIDQVSGPAPLLNRLDEVFRTPVPCFGWDF